MYNYKFPYSVLILLFYFVSVSLINILGVFEHNSFFEQLLISSILVYLGFVIPITYFVNYIQNQSGHKASFLHFNFNSSQILLVFISLILVFSIQASTSLTLELFIFLDNKYNIELIKNLILSAKETQSQNLELISNTNLYSNIIFIALIPAVIEELFFRGFIFFELNQNNFYLESNYVPKFKKYFVIISSLLFAFMHFNFLFFIQYFLISVILSYSYIKSRNIIVPTIIHFFNNLLVILINLKS